MEYYKLYYQANTISSSFVMFEKSILRSRDSFIFAVERNYVTQLKKSHNRPKLKQMVLFCTVFFNNFLLTVCRTDFAEYDLTEPTLLLKQMLGQIQFKCLYHMEGCERRTGYNDYLSHEMWCDYNPAAWDTCQYCDKKYIKTEIDYHFTKCPVKVIIDPLNEKISDLQQELWNAENNSSEERRTLKRELNDNQRITDSLRKNWHTQQAEWYTAGYSQSVHDHYYMKFIIAILIALIMLVVLCNDIDKTPSDFMLFHVDSTSSETVVKSPVDFTSSETFDPFTDIRREISRNMDYLLIIIEGLLKFLYIPIYIFMYTLRYVMYIMVYMFATLLTALKSPSLLWLRTNSADIYYNIYYIIIILLCDIIIIFFFFLLWANLI